MKNIFLIFILIALSTNISIGQEPLKFDKIIQIDSIGKSKLFTLINQWFASTYNSSNDVLQFVDKEEGVIIGKGQMTYDYGKLLYNSYTGHVNYTIKIQVKDNKFKIEISDFVHKIDIGNAPSCELGLITTDENFTNKGLSKSYHNNTWKDLKLKINKYSNSIFTSIETAIKNKIKDKTEW